MFKNSIILISLLFIISGCQSTKAIVIESEFLRQLNRSGVAVETIKSVELNNTELMTLTHVANKFANFSDKWKTAGDALKYGGDELKEDYLIVKAAYLDLYKLTVKHQHQYSAHNWQKLKEWHRRAVALDEAAMDYAAHEEYMRMAGQVINYVKVGVLTLKDVVK